MLSKYHAYYFPTHYNGSANGLLLNLGVPGIKKLEMPRLSKNFCRLLLYRVWLRCKVKQGQRAGPQTGAELGTLKRAQYISLLIIFCIIEYVTNKKTLNLE